MKDSLKILSSAIAGGLLTLGGIHTFGGAVQPVDDDTDFVLKQYVDAQNRIGEPPVLDASVISPEQMSNAIKELATEKGISIAGSIDLTQKLEERAAQDGRACK